MSDGERAQVIGPSLNKLRALSTRTALRLVLGQSQGIDLHERGIARHRVTWVREMPSEETRALKADECVVDRIEIEAVTPEQAAKAFDIRLQGES